jgi:hypothetical protein
MSVFLKLQFEQRCRDVLPSDALFSAPVESDKASFQSIPSLQGLPILASVVANANEFSFVH